MKVKLSCSIAGDRFSFRPRQVITCSDRAGAQLIASGTATEAAAGAEVEGRLPEGKDAAAPAPAARRAPEKAAKSAPRAAVTMGAPARCKGVTGRGNPCLRAPAKGKELCGQHGG